MSLLQVLFAIFIVVATIVAIIVGSSFVTAFIDDCDLKDRFRSTKIKVGNRFYSGIVDNDPFVELDDMHIVEVLQVRKGWFCKECYVLYKDLEDNEVYSESTLDFIREHTRFDSGLEERSKTVRKDVGFLLKRD